MEAVTEKKYVIKPGSLLVEYYSVIHSKDLRCRR